MENPGTVVEPTSDNKSVKKKKPKLTAEEKKAKKLEKKRLLALKRIEKEKQLIRDQLNRDLKYSKKNYENVSKNWLKFMNGLKSSELKKNLEVSVHRNLSMFLRFLVCVVLNRKHGPNLTTFLIGRIITLK